MCEISKTYEAPELEVVRLAAADVIVASGDGNENEGELIPDL